MNNDELVALFDGCHGKSFDGTAMENFIRNAQSGSGCSAVISPVLVSSTIMPGNPNVKIDVYESNLFTVIRAYGQIDIFENVQIANGADIPSLNVPNLASYTFTLPATNNTAQFSYTGPAWVNGANADPNGNGYVNLLLGGTNTIIDTTVTYLNFTGMPYANGWS